MTESVERTPDTLTSRLRDVCLFTKNDWQDDVALCRQAADEIDRLSADLTAARAEIKRLREALLPPQDREPVQAWSVEEKRLLQQAFKRGQERHGDTETLFAVATAILRYRAALGDQP